MLKEKRASIDAECEERQRTRQLEMEACSKACSVLSSDEAHGLLAKTFTFAVIQEAEGPEPRTAAAQVLPSVAIQNKSPRLATITNADDGSIISQNLSSSHCFQSEPFVLPKSELAFSTQVKNSLFPHKSEARDLNGLASHCPLDFKDHENLCADKIWDKYPN